MLMRISRYLTNRTGRTRESVNRGRSGGRFGQPRHEADSLGGSVVEVFGTSGGRGARGDADGGFAGGVSSGGRARRYCGRSSA